MTRASIIIVNYNTYALLSDCLRSIQPVLSDFDEVIVVDNQSTAVIDKQIPIAFPWVKYIESERNVGVGPGNNIGAKHAQGQYLVFINPDITVTNGWLDSLINVLESHPGVGMVTPKILIMQEPKKINTCGLDVHITGISLCRSLEQPAESRVDVEEVNAISGTAFIIRKDLFERIGGFDDQVFMYMEDIDISMRGRLAGYTCMFNPNSVVYHKYSLTIGPKKIFFQEYHRYLILLKTYRLLTLLILLPSLILSEIVTWGFVLLRDQKNWKNKLKAYQLVLKNSQHIIKTHRETQLIRKVKDRHLILSQKIRLEYEQTGEGIVSVISHLIFDSLFFIFSLFARLLIWW